MKLVIGALIISTVGFGYGAEITGNFLMGAGAIVSGVFTLICGYAAMAEKRT